ncbi:MAG: hypothetical protein HYY17_10150 [Planctomycetes bacterium]|nr:hypothetical protein [Planctomycetota bacterium]
MMHLPRRARTTGWLALLLLARPSLSLAVEAEPAFLTKELTPGKSDGFKITLRTSRPAETVWIQPVDYSIDRRGQVSIEPRKDVRYSGRAWSKLRPTQLTLRKGRDEVVNVPMLVPHRTPAGEYYMGVQIYTVVSDPSQDQPLRVKVEVNLVVLVILDIKGHTPKLGAEIVDPKIVVRDSIPEVQATFHSLSTVSAIARMAVVVRDGERKIVDKFQLKAASSPQPDGQAFVLPEGLRDFAGEGNRKLPPGRYFGEIFSVFGAKPQRVSKPIEFEVAGGGTKPDTPLADVRVTPEKAVLEIPAGGMQTAMLVVKNRGFDPVDLVWKAPDGVSFFPDRLRLEPGKSLKVQVRVRLPAAQDPRRDLPVELLLEGGTEKDRKLLGISVYAPGTAPEK